MKTVNLRGEPFYIHDDEALSNHIVRENDFFEAPILDFLVEYLPKQRVIVDVGANIGNHTLFFSRFIPHTYIYAFEPILENYVILRENVRNRDDIIAFPLALSSSFGTLDMSINRTNMGASSWDINGGIEAPMMALDDLEVEDISFLKIDVESFEPQVLKGARETIQKYRPIILIEDWYNEYGPLLPNYELVKRWEIEKTNLLRWKD